VPAIPPDEDEVTFARRLIAQRCLYGVDRNPVAVDIAKVSLWLVTLAKDHALTFVDHALLRQCPGFDAATFIEFAEMRHRLLNDAPPDPHAAHQPPIAVNLTVFPQRRVA
jgi:hypothetical protein